MSDNTMKYYCEECKRDTESEIQTKASTVEEHRWILIELTAVCKTCETTMILDTPRYESVYSDISLGRLQKYRTEFQELLKQGEES